MAGMTPKRVPQRGTGPQRFTPRAASSMPGKVRRALDGQIVSDQRNDGSLQVDSGRLGVRLASKGGIKMTNKGLILDPDAVGEKNRAQLARIGALPSSSSTTDLIDTVNALIAQLKKTGNMRG